MLNVNDMSKDGSSTKHHVLIVTLFFLLACSLLIPGIITYRKAFPEASIDFKISKAEALFRAKSFLEKRKIDLNGYFDTIRFDYDGISKTYLDREVGVERMNALIADEVYLWRWKVRWFKPHEQEEYEVSLSPEGWIVGFLRILPEEEKRESLEQEEAFLLAEDFLKKEAAVPLSRYDFIEQDFETLKNRTDFHFTWKRKDWDAPDREYRISVTVQGDAVGSYRGFIKIPEEWRRDYSRMRSRNQLLQRITFFLTLPLLIFVPITLLIRMRRGDICWTIILSLCLCIFLSHVLLGINSIPILLSQFDTTRSMGNFAGTLSLSILIEALLNAVIIFLIVGASEPLYREQNPTRLSLSKFLNTRFFKTKEFFCGTLVGYSLALFHIGYVVLFYYFGRKAGVWSPAEVGYTDALSTFLPWIYPLTVSLTAALTEEFLFRVFAISVLRKFLPTWMAVLIPAFLWGFLHSNYPQQPFFIRGIELGILGIIAGYVFLRWGVLATLIWHYTIDAVFIGLFLFSATNLYFVVSGTIVMGLLLIPLVLAFFGLLKERRFASSSGLLNSDVSEEIQQKRKETKPLEPQIGREPLALNRHTFSKKTVGVVLAVSVTSLLFLAFLKTPRPWPSIQLQVDGSHAESLASHHLAEQGIETDPFTHVVHFADQTGNYEDRYIQNVAGWSGLQEAYRLFKETGRWKVRFFRPMSEEEYVVSLDEEGMDPVLSHLLPEKEEASGTTRKKAKERAEQYLREDRGLPLEEYVLVDSYEDQKPGRTDYHFVWMWEKEKAGDGEYRVSVSMAGEEVTQYSKFIKVPEKWIRKDREEDFFRVLFSFLKVLMLSLGGGLAIVFFARDFLHRQIAWKHVLVLPSIAVLLYAVLEMNRLPILLTDYRTNLSLFNYVLSEILARLLNAAGLFLFFIIVAAAVLSLFKEIYGNASFWPERPWSQRGVLGYPLAAGFSAFLLITAFTRIFAWINYTLDIPRAQIAGESLLKVETYFPALEILVSALLFALIGTLLIFFGLFLYQRYIRRARYLFLVAVPAVAIYFIAEVKNISELALLFIASFIGLTIAFSVLNRFHQGKMLACFLALLWMKAVPQSLWLTSQPLGFYRIQGLLSLVIIILVLPWMLISFCKRKREEHVFKNKESVS